MYSASSTTISSDERNRTKTHTVRVLQSCDFYGYLFKMKIINDKCKASPSSPGCDSRLPPPTLRQRENSAEPPLSTTAFEQRSTSFMCVRTLVRLNPQRACIYILLSKRAIRTGAHRARRYWIVQSCTYILVRMVSGTQTKGAGWPTDWTEWKFNNGQSELLPAGARWRAAGTRERSASIARRDASAMVQRDEGESRSSSSVRTV
jgi:hypothetical protein